MSKFNIIDENKTHYYVEFVSRKGNDADGEINPLVIKRWVKKKNVRALNNIIRKAPKREYKNGKLSCHYIGEKICNRFGFQQFFSGKTFMWPWFFGARALYMNYYNFPLKILEHQKKITYHKNGKVSLL